MDRNKSIEKLRGQSEPFDIIVIGGGASGLGAAVDAAARGHRVALFEQADFAKGTSSRSTKLVHGGVRYLRQGNISLVLEALRERGRLAQNAPHLVHSQAFVIPNYSWWEGPFYGIGMKVYDQLAGRLGLEPSRTLNREETIREIPTVEQENLQGGVIYHDGQFDDSRLAINLAQSAQEHGGVILNYCRCTALIKEDGAVSGVKIKDLEGGHEFELAAKVVINATGVFADGLRKQDDPSAQAIIQASQGIHIVLPKEFLPGDSAIMIPKTGDGRVLFAVPWHDHVVVGTTDTPVDNAALEPRALREERDYLMTHACQYLAKDPTEADVLSVFAGLRPLVKSGKSADTSALSRDHSILVSESGLMTMTGGKWTTYRKMAEDAIEQAETLGDLEPKACPTQKLKIHGWTEQTGERDHLSVYGSDREAVEELIRSDPDLGEKLHPALPYLRAEVLWQVRMEMARTVEDVLARRTRALLLNAAASIEAAPAVAKLMARGLERDADWQQTQVDNYTQLARGYVFTDSRSTAPDRP